MSALIEPDGKLNVMLDFIFQSYESSELIHAEPKQILGPF